MRAQKVPKGIASEGVPTERLPKGTGPATWTDGTRRMASDRIRREDGLPDLETARPRRRATTRGVTQVMAARRKKAASKKASRKKAGTKKAARKKARRKSA